jgi:aryl-alcohol dehydrogenase-like predicted oxidoreductase
MAISIFGPGRIGLGCGALGDLEPAAAQAMIDGALERGVRLFDTARSYGTSEEKLGRALGTRGLVSTKGGYGVEPVEEWTPQAITAGIARAREIMQRPCIDLFFLHSCPLPVLQRPGLVEALEAAKDKGWIRHLGYSGDGEALSWVIETGRFDAVQASYSVFDQSNAPALRRAKERKMRVLAKRPLAGSVWERSPNDDATRAYATRMHELHLLLPMPWLEAAVRFASWAPFVDVALVGTKRLEHLSAALDASAKGPLDDALVALIEERFQARSGGAWPAYV